MARHGITQRSSSPVKIARAKELRRAMTRSEAILWERLRRNGLMGLHFYRQVVIAGFIVDFYCPAALLVVEVDGAIHEQQLDYDRARDQALKDAGLSVLRVTNREVEEQLSSVLQRIIAACQRGA